MAFNAIHHQHGSEMSDVYKVVPISGKGLGMLTKRSIEQGARIFDEEVLFTISGGLSEEQKKESVTSAYRSLPPDKKMAFLSLYNPYPANLAMRLVSRYNANAFEISNLSDHLRPIVSHIVCLQASRINHSCTPNAYLDLNTNINRVTVHAVADIPAEQEITVSYCAPHYSRDDRVRDLGRYVFNCRCTVCQPTAIGQLKEAERLLMQETWLTLYDRDGKEISYPNHNQMKSILRMIQLLTEQRLNVGALSVLYQRAVILNIELGCRRVALQFAEEKLRLEMLRLGPDSPLIQKTMLYVTRLKSDFPPLPFSQSANRSEAS